MTKTVCFNVDDPHLNEEERRTIAQLSAKLIARRDQEPTANRAPDPRALEAQHHKLSRGDL